MPSNPASAPADIHDALQIGPQRLGCRIRALEALNRAALLKDIPAIGRLTRRLRHSRIGLVNDRFGNTRWVATEVFVVG